MSNIKVYLRIKPNPADSTDAEDQNLASNGSSPTQTLRSPLRAAHTFKVGHTKLGKSLSIKSDKKHFNDRRFEFEDIFEPQVAQAELFSHFQERILESATNGVR
jgi:hypothetical protein